MKDKKIKDTHGKLTVKHNPSIKPKIKNNKGVEDKKAVSRTDKDKKSLKIRFLGGVGEIGKNMTAL